MPLICFTSPKGGVGKTTFAANIAAELAAAGRRVIALDLDPQGSLGLHFGRDPQAADEGLEAAEQWEAGAWRRKLVSTRTGVLLLPRGRLELDRVLTLSAALASRPELLIAPLKEMIADPTVIVVADTLAGPSVELAILAPYCDMFAIVLLSDAASVAQIPAIEAGLTYGPRIAPDRIRFILNQVDNRLRLSRAVSRAAARHLGPRLLGMVYRDEIVAEALAAQRTVREYAPQSKAAQDFAFLAAQILKHISATDPRSATDAAWPVEKLYA